MSTYQSTKRNRLYTRKSVEELSVPEALTGCWLWIGQGARLGYGTVTRLGKRQMAHRFAYESLVGPIPEGAVVCHRCDTPACVNPDHLFLGTQKQNLQDMGRKGRSPHPRKLTVAQVLELRALRAAGASWSDLGKKYAIAPSSAHRIGVGRTYAEVV